MTKISIQLEKNQKDLPAFDVVENLVEEEVFIYKCTVVYTQQNRSHAPSHKDHHTKVEVVLQPFIKLCIAILSSVICVCSYNTNQWA